MQPKLTVLALQLGVMGILGAILALAHYQFGWGVGASLGFSFAASLGLLLAYAAVSDAKRMNYSEPASGALQQFSQGLEERLIGGNTGIIKVATMWSYGYPKVALLFSSKEAIAIAESNGLLSTLASEVSEFVRLKAVFGKNRESFDTKKALFFTADIEMWKSFEFVILPEKPVPSVE